MRISRLYVPVPLAVNATIQLDDDSAHYVRSVLRLKKGYQLVVFNGQGGEYTALISEVSRKQVLIQLQTFIARSVEPHLPVRLGLGVSRGERMDFAVQKSVELGVATITPLLTERCVVQINEANDLNKRRHWQKIAQHACEQSGRTVCPEIAEFAQLQSWATTQVGLKIFLDPFAEQTLTQLAVEAEGVTLLAGPEGGFSEQECHLAKQSGFIPVRLGPRILRTETAALAAITAVMVLWGDLGAQ